MKDTIVIIGGGASSLLVASNLLRNPYFPLRIVIISSSENFGLGVAYSQHFHNHLLNVTAGKMSAVHDDPDHFVRWLINTHSLEDIEPELISKCYFPRKFYGDYLSFVWAETLFQRHGSMELEIITNRALNVTKTANKFHIHLQDGKVIESDHVVLATGNAPPRNPPIANSLFYQSKNYFRNPWLSSATENLDPDKDVFIIGNGLTMVDTVLSLAERKMKGTIHSISPHGFGILQHRHNGTSYSGLLNAIKPGMSLHQFVGLFNKHIKKVRRLGLSAEPVIDSLRPLTQSIWRSFSLSEKEKFMSRLRHLWGVARHRLPIQVYDTIQKLKIEGKLKIWAGKIQNITEENGMVRVDFFDKKSKALKSISVARVINCTGPEVDIQRMNDPLFDNLIRSGIINPDHMNLGLDADPDSLQVLDKEHQVVNSLFAIGGLLRGVFWESTAIPEIRMQSKIIADQIFQRQNVNA